MTSEGGEMEILNSDRLEDRYEFGISLSRVVFGFLGLLLCFYVVRYE